MRFQNKNKRLQRISDENGPLILKRKQKRNQKFEIVRLKDFFVDLLTDP